MGYVYFGTGQKFTPVKIGNSMAARIASNQTYQSGMSVLVGGSPVLVPTTVDFATVKFPVGGDARLHSIEAHLEFFITGFGLIEYNKNTPTNFEWTVYGQFLSESGKPPNCMASPIITGGNDTYYRTFANERFQVFLSKYRQEIKPECVFGSIWQLSQLQVVSNVDFDNSSQIFDWGPGVNDPFLRLRLQFCFEV